jgi:hypothetical protein
LRKRGHASSCPKRVLVVIGLSDIGKHKHPERIERRCSFTQAAAPRWRLIEDESKPAVEPSSPFPIAATVIPTASVPLPLPSFWVTKDIHLLHVTDDNDMKRTSRRKN